MSATPIRTEAADGAVRGASAGALKESDETAMESMSETCPGVQRMCQGKAAQT